MTTQRDQFLNNVRQQLQAAHLPDAVPEHPGLFTGNISPPDVSPDELLAQFTRELEALSGQVHVTETMQQTLGTVLAIVRQTGAGRVLMWRDDSGPLMEIRATLERLGIVLEQNRLSTDSDARRVDLAAIDYAELGISGAQGALADTGAIALISGPGQGRLASLLPPVHVAILSRQQIYADMAAFLAAHPDAATQGSNLVFIAGPSRTGDIEMTLTMGVHGPGELHVIITP